jgi:hypothetical protein
MKPRDYRNLHPTPAAIVAMAIFGEEYAAQNGGSMDFWDTLHPAKKRRCEDTARRVIEANREAGG